MSYNSLVNEVLVIDIGGTKTNVSLVRNEKDQIQIYKSKTFKTCAQPEEEILKIQETYSSFLLKASNLSLSLPGKWTKDGFLTESYFLKDWIQFPFINKVLQSLGIKSENCSFDTDVICGALGEWNLGTHKGKSLLYLNIGTGIGAAYIDKDGKLFQSEHDLTLRIQKLVSPSHDGLAPAVDLLLSEVLLQNSGYNSTEELFNAYREASPVAIDLLLEAHAQLAACLINLYYLFAPEVIILNGGLTYEYDVLCEEAVDISFEELGKKVEIIQSSLKEKAPIYGASINFFKTNKVIV